MKGVCGLHKPEEGVPKILFPLLSIDRMVDPSARHQILTFIDAFLGYNNIFIHPVDQKKTYFITKHCTYYYKVMSFSHKYASATYQSLVNKIFMEEIRRSVEVYVDDVLVKSHFIEEHNGDLARAFEIFKKYKMKLNLAKCTFIVEVGKF